MVVLECLRLGACRVCVFSDSEGLLLDVVLLSSQSEGTNTGMEPKECFMMGVVNDTKGNWEVAFSRVRLDRSDWAHGCLLKERMRTWNQKRMAWLGAIDTGKPKRRGAGRCAPRNHSGQPMDRPASGEARAKGPGSCTVTSQPVQPLCESCSRFQAHRA